MTSLKNETMRVSVTRLESMRLLRCAEWMTWERFVEQLTGKFVETEAMKRGAAVHKLLQYVDDYIFEPEGPLIPVTVRGTTFYFWVDSVFDFIEACPLDGVAEVPTSKVFDTPVGKVEVTGRADLLRGLTVRDYKLSNKPPDADFYGRSLQWRAYLDLFDCNAFEYVFLKLDEYESDEGSGLWLNYHGTLREYSYDNVECDIINATVDYVNTLKRAGLDRYLYGRSK